MNFKIEFDNLGRPGLAFSGVKIIAGSSGNDRGYLVVMKGGKVQCIGNSGAVSAIVGGDVAINSSGVVALPCGIPLVTDGGCAQLVGEEKIGDLFRSTVNKQDMLMVALRLQLFVRSLRMAYTHTVRLFDLDRDAATLEFEA